MTAYADICARQVDWYSVNGRYPHERIVKDRDGVAYVVGDWAWNRSYPDHEEYIEKYSGFANCECAPESEGDSEHR